MSLQQMTEQAEIDKRAPMASAPMKFTQEGQVDWGAMWDSYCVLAQDGGPPHRETVLLAPQNPDVDSAGYQYAVAEIVRGIKEVSELTAVAATPGWIGVQCESAAMAAWLRDAIEGENVQARASGRELFVPVGEQFALKGEIKNVITAVAKTTHYWQEHLAVEVKQTLALQQQLETAVGWVKGLFGGRRSKQPI